MAIDVADAGAKVGQESDILLNPGRTRFISSTIIISCVGHRSAPQV